jgi:polyisoprenoid-binding protein YceI
MCGMVPPPQQKPVQCRNAGFWRRRPGWGGAFSRCEIFFTARRRCEIATLNAVLGVYRDASSQRIFGGMKTNANDSGSTFWTIDPIHTTVSFGVRHLMITTVRGVFDRVSGSVRFDPTEPDATEIRVEIPVDSVNTRAPQRDAHLRSADFFDAEHHPLITFQSTSVRSTGQDSLVVVGNLTMRGVTREVVLNVGELSSVASDFNGQPRLGGSATAELKRSEFGMTFNKLLDAGGLAIADEVSLRIDVSLQKAAAVAAA